MYQDNMVKCQNCGNEVPVIPAPPSSCRECGYNGNTYDDALEDAIRGLEGMKQRGFIGHNIRGRLIVF